MQVAAAVRYNRSGGPPRDGYVSPAGHPAHQMQPNGDGLEAFAAQQPQPGQGGPPNGMLPSPLPLNLPPNTRGPPSQKPHRSLNSPHPARPPPNPNLNHPAMPYRQQMGPPQPALPSGPLTPLPMRQPSAPRLRTASCSRSTPASLLSSLCLGASFRFGI